MSCWFFGDTNVPLHCHLRKKRKKKRRKRVKVNNEEEWEVVENTHTVVVREIKQLRFQPNSPIPLFLYHSYIHRCSIFSARLLLLWPLFLVPGFVSLSLSLLILTILLSFHFFSEIMLWANCNSTNKGIN